MSAGEGDVLGEERREGREAASGTSDLLHPVPLTGAGGGGDFIMPLSHCPARPDPSTDLGPTGEGLKSLLFPRRWDFLNPALRGDFGLHAPNLLLSIKHP